MGWILRWSCCSHYCWVWAFSKVVQMKPEHPTFVAMPKSPNIRAFQSSATSLLHCNDWSGHAKISCASVACRLKQECCLQASTQPWALLCSCEHRKRFLQPCAVQWETRRNGLSCVYQCCAEACFQQPALQAYFLVCISWNQTSRLQRILLYTVSNILATLYSHQQTQHIVELKDVSSNLRS